MSGLVGVGVGVVVLFLPSMSMLRREAILRRLDPPRRPKRAAHWRSSHTACLVVGTSLR